MPRTLRETAALVSLAAAPLVVPYLERVNGPLLPEQKAMLGSVLFVVGVNHRDALLDVALALLAAPGNLLTRIVGDDDDESGQDAPPLVPLVAGGATTPTPEPAPEPLAYARCRHDRGACARQPPPEFQRVWDDALGMVPLDARERWRAAEAPVAAASEAPPPPRPRFVGRT